MIYDVQTIKLHLYKHDFIPDYFISIDHEEAIKNISIMLMMLQKVVYMWLKVKHLNHWMTCCVMLLDNMGHLKYQKQLWRASEWSNLTIL